MRTASALTCRARPGGEDGNLQPRPREPWERSHLAVSWVPGAHAVTSLAPKGHRTSPPASSPALHVPQGLLGESPRSLLVGGQGCVLPPAVNPVHRPFAGKLRSPFLQRQLPQPESPLGGERAHAASRPSAGKALGHPAGWGGGDGVSSPSPGSEPAAPLLQVSVRSRRPVPLRARCRWRRRPCTRSPQTRRPSTRSPPWWVPCSWVRAARAWVLRQPPQPHLGGSLPCFNLEPLVQ